MEFVGRIWKIWAPVIVWAAFIFALSAIPHLTTGLSCDFLLRKAAHVAEYFILSYFLYRAISGTFKFQGLHLSLSLAGAVFFYAASDELHQFFITGRYASIHDVLIDLLGAVLFLAFLYLASRVPALKLLPALRAKK